MWQQGVGDGRVGVILRAPCENSETLADLPDTSPRRHALCKALCSEQYKINHLLTTHYVPNTLVRLLKLSHLNLTIRWTL